MKVLRGATWIWWCMMMMMMMMGVMSSLTMEEVELAVGKNKNPSITTIEYDLNTRDTDAEYKKFLKDIRENKNVAPDKVCDIKTLGSSPNFIHVKLKASTKTITVALDSRDLYVLGYSDEVKLNGKYRARFFKDVKQDIMDKVFDKKIYTNKNTKWSENYQKLAPETRFNRDRLDLKVSTIKEVFDGVYGKSEADLVKQDKNRGRPETNFLFVMCQMISEATRFEFMEIAIIDGTISDNSVSKELKEFQNNWNKAAKAIYESMNNCNNVSVKIGDKTYNIDELRKKITVIKAERKK